MRKNSKLAITKIHIIIIISLIILGSVIGVYYFSTFESNNNDPPISTPTPTPSPVPTPTLPPSPTPTPTNPPTPTPTPIEITTSLSASLSKNPVIIGELFTISISVSPSPPSGEIYKIHIDWVDPDNNFVNGAIVNSDSNGAAIYETSLSPRHGTYEIIITHGAEILDGNLYGGSYKELTLIVEETTT